MSDWNQDYKNKPYNTYGGSYYSGGEYGGYIALGISFIIGFLGLMAFMNHAIKEYGMEKVVGWAFGILILISFASVLTVGIYYYIMDWWDRKFGYAPTAKDYNTVNTSNTTAIAPKKETFINKTTRGFKTTGLLAGEREKPPYASFFGRLDGQPVETQGDYEEQWLNTFELTHWLKQKERKQLLTDGSVSENDEHSDLCVNTTTKIDYE